MVLSEDAAWVRPGERVAAVLIAQWRTGGSRIGGEVRLPHPPARGLPPLLDLKAEHPPPVEATADAPGTGWTEDDAVGWWAEAADPAHAAARLADALAAGRGRVNLVVTDRRIAVVLPEKLLASSQKKRGLLGRVVGGLLDTHEWTKFDRVVSLYETDPAALRGMDTFLVGRSFPFARLARLSFTDGSALFLRRHLEDTW